MIDLPTELRKVVLPALKSDAALVAIVPAASIYPQTTPANVGWPFTKIGVPIITGFDGSTYVGASIRYTVHSFAKKRVDGSGEELESAEDHVGRISAAVKGVLHLARFDIPGGRVHLRWIAGQRLQDGSEADAFHAVDEFRARVLAR